MNSSGIKRGLATTAVTALAVTGIPLIASTAHAVPLEDHLQVTGVELLTPEETNTTGPDADGISTKDDGTNSTVSLVAVAEGDVTTVAFQYRLASESGDDEAWRDISGAVARNANGAFETEWAPEVPVGTAIEIRAIGDTEDSDVATVTVLGSGAGVYTVELATEGDLGIFQNPITDEDSVAVRGTTSDPAAGGGVAIYDQLNGENTSTPAVEGEDGVSRFEAVLSYSDYPYSVGTEPNQVAISAALGYPQTTDTEASTLYIQTVGSVTVEPENENITGGTTPTTVTVLDQRGKPVAGATVGYLEAVEDNPATPTVEPPLDQTEQGTTDANGQVTLPLGPGTYTVYADVEDEGNDNNGEYSEGDVTAAPITIGQYTARFDSIEIVNERERSNFDQEELADTDDFTIRTEDQLGNPINEDLAGADVQYRYVIDPTGAAPAVTTGWQDAETAGNGEVAVAGPLAAYRALDSVPNDAALPDGAYTLEARRPNVNGTGLTNAQPVQFTVAQSEITFDEGAEANAPIEGEFTVTGTLANDAGGLGGREVTINLTQREDARLADQADQPQGVTRTSATQATVITDAQGNFSINLIDPAGPVVVEDNPEDVTVRAASTGEDKTDNTSTGAVAELVVHFAAPAEVGRIDVDVDELFGETAPGKPVDLDITVFAADNTASTADDVELVDYPVTVSVDKGFLSPNAETVNDLSLDEAHDDEGDLFGFYENLGQEQELSTGDNREAGVVATIERDEDFDDDGRVTMTITVTAGGVTETEEVTFDSREFLNAGDFRLVRAEGAPAGEVEVGNEVGFNLVLEDQFGNLVGEQVARISDDSTVADFRTDGEFNRTETDFTTSGTGIVAFSEAPAVQTLTASITDASEVLVGDNEDADEGTRNITTTSDPITWVEAPVVVDPPEEIVATIKAKNNGAKNDRLRIITKNDKAAGANVKVFRVKKNGKRVLVKQKALNSNGNVVLWVKDRNGKKFTKYVAKVQKTELTRGALSNVKRVR